MQLRPRNRGDNNNNNNRVELDPSKEYAYHPPKVGAKIFESSFFDTILESSGVSQHAETNIEYEDIRKSLELHYGVEITPDAVQAASEILTFIYVCNGAQNLPKVGVAQLLEEAASRLRNDFDNDSGEKDLDRYMFLFDRAFVESREIEKEKDLKMAGFPYVKEELEELKCVLEAFKKRWAATSPLEDHMSLAQIKYLECLRQGISGILLDTESHGNLDLVAKAMQGLHDPLFGLLHTVDASLKRLRTVNSRTIVEVASSITGVPRSFFPAPFQLPLELLMRRLSGRVVGLDNQLQTILNAMSNQKPRSNRLYSFLLLGPPGSGKTALAHALAKEMFDDRIVEYNLADFMEKDFIEQVCTSAYSVSGETDGTSDSSIQFISGCVVVFDNVDKANTTVLDSILQILESGSYVDAVGRRIVFSNILILFTLSVRFSSCRCPRFVCESSFKPPFKSLLNSVKEMKVPDCSCNFHERLTEATDRFNPRFLDSLDDVIVLAWLSMSHYMSMFRIQVRNVAPLCEKKVVVYSSAAVFHHAWRNYIIGMPDECGRAVQRFVEDLFSGLCDVEGESIVYIDQLLGSNELSFRIQKISDMAIVHDLMTFKESLRNSMISYQFEKEQAKQIYKLSTTYFGLVELLDSKDEASLSCVLSSVSELLDMAAYQLARSHVNYWTKQVRPQFFIHDTDNVHDWAKRARYMSEVEFTKMRNELVKQVPPVQVVAKALFKSIDAYHGNCEGEPCQQASSFLVLGLRSMDRCFVDSLSKYFAADDGTRMLVEVDLSACTNPNSFFRCTCRNEPGLLLKTAILMRPYSIIVFYNLELAHLSAFVNIISILDDGLLFDDDGIVLDFRKSVIIFVSNLGNKHIIAKLVGGPDGSDSWDGTINEGSIGFRFELLNRVHEILLFNPFASEQLLHSARLPMKVGQHLLVTVPGITSVLVHLFNNVKRESDGCGKQEVDGKMTKAGNCRSRLTESDAVSCLFPLRKGLVKF